MGRGIFFGGFWGLVVGGIVLSVASLLGEVPGRVAPEAAPVEVPAGSEFDQAREDAPVQAPTEVAPAPEVISDAPLVTAPEAPVAPALGQDVTASAAVPEAGAADELATPPEGASGSGVTVRLEEAPQETVEVAEDPAPAPETADVPDISTEPAAPIQPVVTEVETEALPETAPEPLAEEEVEPAPEPVDEPEPVVELEIEAPPVAAQETEQPNEPEVTVEADPAPEEQETATPESASAPEASGGGFGDLAEGIRVNRPGEDAPVDNTPQERPIEAYSEAAQWSGPDERPLVSIVILDEAGDASRLGAIQSFNGPLTFAIPADTPDANATMRAYRDAGHEVLLVADIAQGSTAADIEIAFQSYFSTVPEAIGVLDGSLSGFNGDRRISEQVTQILSESGHGLLTVAQGLNTTSQLAARDGVPAGTIFRDLDGNGQGNTVIRRFLDQAAFRAGQEGEVILLARMRGETISALLIWAQQDRARRVNLAPLSAVLTNDIR